VNGIQLNERQQQAHEEAGRFPTALYRVTIAVRPGIVAAMSVAEVTVLDGAMEPVEHWFAGCLGTPEQARIAMAEECNRDFCHRALYQPGVSAVQWRLVGEYPTHSDYEVVDITDTDWL
jgi:hypothetical protein